jgi:superoxide dismutase
VAHTLPPLPYAFDALEPHIDAKTMEIHHDKHHAAYVDNLNKALEPYPELAEVTIEELLRHLEGGERPCELMEQILRERLVENQEKIELFAKRQALMERALRHLENRTWGTANMDGLCDEFQSLIAENRA